MIKFRPAIKWTGSKRSQVNEILKYFPSEINTYYEPFCGGCAILRGLLETGIEVEKYYCSDVNLDLINLWNEIKENPSQVINHYTKLWEELNQDNDIVRKKDFYNEIRDRLNKKHDPLDFMFIMRTTMNGMPRYNKNGDFNSSFHLTRNGMKPSTLNDILVEWSLILNENDVEFKRCSYEEICSDDGDFLYLDPPYANTKGIYYNDFDVMKYFKWLSLQKGGYMFSFDGKVNGTDYSVEVPREVYTKHIYIDSGNSSFRRIIGKSKNSMVKESLYLK